jgi:hypothetical protein
MKFLIGVLFALSLQGCVSVQRASCYVRKPGRHYVERVVKCRLLLDIKNIEKYFEARKKS